LATPQEHPYYDKSNKTRQILDAKNLHFITIFFIYRI